MLTATAMAKAKAKATAATTTTTTHSVNSVSYETNIQTLFRDWAATTA